MLMRLLTDYHPEGVIVAGDSGRAPPRALPGLQGVAQADAVAAQAAAALLRPLVEAFGYRNVEHEGYEADDVIGTLSLRADEQGSRRA